MSDEERKPWERPWSTQEMIQNASKWNLAGDAGLLKYLEEFSEKMLTKVKDTNDRLSDLMDTAEETTLALNNATNKFMGLRNTQFIESRVYDDDETLPTIQKQKEQEPKPKTTENDRLEEMKSSIFNGLKIIDKYYEKVEIAGSDSEDSEDSNIIYRPIDPYSDRPLPYVIGSSEWHKYWHVGLGHSSSDSEVESDQEQFSETESENEFKIAEKEPTEILWTSDSESELPATKMMQPVASSTFNDNTPKYMFDSSSDSDAGSWPYVNTANCNFAEELAAELGKVEESNIKPEINTKPIRKASMNPAGLFSDEPPPLDDDDIFSSKNINSGLFSVDDDNDFWNTKKINTKKPTSVAPETNKNIDDLFAEDNDLFSNESKKLEENIKSKPVPNQKKSLDLFDDDDDELFSTAVIHQPKKTILAPFKSAAPLVSEEPPEIDQPAMKNPRKKPVGGVSILGPNALLNSEILKKRAPSSTSESETEPEPEKKEPQKLPSIFDDNSPLFSDDIFNNTSAKKLFELESPEKNDEISFKKSEKIDCLEENDLFRSEPPPLSDSESVKSKPRSFLDNDDDDEDLFSTKSSKVIPVSKNKVEAVPNLFDDNSNIDDDDDLFSSKSSNLFAPSLKKSVDLFDPNPPELDDSEEQVSVDNYSYGTINAGRASLFDAGPQMSNESSGIVPDQSTRLESEDSSFYPFMTSSRRHSDMFQENQTGDSLLTAKNNKLSVGDSNLFGKSLSKIPEQESITKIDITPSGNESSLIDDDSSVFHNDSKPEIVGEKPEVAAKKVISLFGKDENDLFVEQKKVAREKNSSLFQESDSDDDLFSSKSTGSKNSNASEVLTNSQTKLKDKNIFEDELFAGPNMNSNKQENVESKDIFDRITSDDKKDNVEKCQNDVNDSKKFHYEENLKSDVIKTDPKKSLSFDKNIDVEKTKEEPDGQILSSGSSPGKIKHNLNINVAALLPGATPLRLPGLEKSVSLDSSENNQNAPSSTEETTKTIEKTPEVRPTLEKSVSFDGPVAPGEVLASAVKERVKIPVKRRPSTRRARQEAIRKSAVDLNYEDAIVESDSSVQKTQTENILNIANNNVTTDKESIIAIPEAQNKEEKTIKNPLLNPLTPSTDEEDFLTMPKEKDLSDNFSDNSLFGKATVISPINHEQKQQTIEIEQKNKTIDDDDDLFTSKTVKNAPDLFSTSKTNNKTADSSIFSSSDSENDLFSTPKSELKKPTSKKVLVSPDEELFKPLVATATAKPHSKFLTRDDSLFDDDDIFSAKKIPPKSDIIKRSLFDDDDDDDNDDIFGGSGTINVPINTTVKKLPATSTSRLRKLPVDLVDDLDDPLEALKK